MRTRFQTIRLIGLLLLPGPAGLHAETHTLPIGEEARYKIQWGVLNCGTSTFRCEEVEWQGKPMIRVRVQAKSNWLVSTIYPVDDTVDCYIDPETGLSVRLEKNTSEGDKICKDILVLDREKNMALWVSESDNITTNYPIEAGSCDAISFLYEFRNHAFEEIAVQDFNIAVDTTLHGITIAAGKREMKKIEDFGKLNCRRYSVTPKHEGLFVRKIPKELWLSEDARKILVRMDVQVPVGRVRILLDQYTPPDR